MQKTILTLFLAIVACSGCARHLHDPHEVVNQEYIHRYGMPIKQQDWHAQGKSGKVVSSLKSGVVISKSYVNGILDGESTYTYPHSEHVEKTQTYAKGVLTQETVSYRNGTIASQTTFPAANKTLIYTWYDNSSPKSQETFTNDALVTGEYYDLAHHLDSRVDNSQGLRTRRNAFGQLVGVDTIKAGINTQTLTYYPNHAIKQIIPYVNHQMHGQLRTFLPGGEPSTIETWAYGEQTGTKTLFENGEKIAEVPYIHGVKNGIEKRFRNGHIVVEEISWHNDSMHGPRLTTIGDVSNIDYFYQGKNVSKSVFEKLTNGILPIVTR
jgi:antitoxin component YwqK of YwqJK toxin-antitoxin module